MSDSDQLHHHHGAVNASCRAWARHARQPRHSCMIRVSSTPSTTTPPITVRGTAVSPNRLTMSAWTRGEVASRMLYLI